MDEDREAGRAVKHRNQRIANVRRARSTLDALRQAGLELEAKRKPISYRRIADWLLKHPELCHEDFQRETIQTMQVKRLLDLTEAISLPDAAFGVEETILKEKLRLKEFSRFTHQEKLLAAFDRRRIEMDENWKLIRELKTLVGRWGDDEEDEYADWLQGEEAQRDDLVRGYLREAERERVRIAHAERSAANRLARQTKLDLDH